MERYLWESSCEPSELLKQYDLKDNYMLNLKQLMFLNLNENIAATKCENCFEQTKGLIRKFFEEADCNHDGFINSEDIFIELKKKKTNFLVTTAMTNDFVLKTMQKDIAHVDLSSFTYGIIAGMIERVVGDNNIDENNLNVQKNGRIRMAIQGFLPGKPPKKKLILLN